MTDPTRRLKKGLLTLPVPQDDVETQLLSWIRGVVQSNHEFGRRDETFAAFI
jgi:hypothetical protein